MVAVTQDAPVGFQPGRVVRRTFGTVRRNLWVYSLLGVLFIIAPRLGLYGLNAGPVAVLRPAGGGVASAVATIVVVSLGWLLHAAVIHAAAADLRGERPGLSASVAAAFRRTWPVLGQAIATTLALALSGLLLGVPALVVTVLWIAAVPALVVEGRGVRASYARSRSLTKGRRWIVFATLVLMGLITLLGVAAMVVVVGAMRMGIDPEIRRAVLEYALIPLALAGYAVVSSAGVAAIYHELKTAKEGEGAEALAAAFD